MGMLIHRHKGRKASYPTDYPNDARSLGTEEMPDSEKYSDSDIEFEEQNNRQQYNKTDINRMNTAELQNLAAENGVNNAYEITGAELKKILIDMWGL